MIMTVFKNIAYNEPWRNSQNSGSDRKKEPLNDTKKHVQSPKSSKILLCSWSHSNCS